MWCYSQTWNPKVVLSSDWLVYLAGFAVQAVLLQQFLLAVHHQVFRRLALLILRCMSLKHLRFSCSGNFWSYFHNWQFPIVRTLSTCESHVWRFNLGNFVVRVWFLNFYRVFKQQLSARIDTLLWLDHLLKTLSVTQFLRLAEWLILANVWSSLYRRRMVLWDFPLVVHWSLAVVLSLIFKTSLLATRSAILVRKLGGQYLLLRRSSCSIMAQTGQLLVFGDWPIFFRWLRILTLCLRLCLRCWYN